MQMTKTVETISKRLGRRFAAGAAVVVVQEPDEELALAQCVAVAELFRPVRIISATGRCYRDDVRDANVGIVMDLGEVVMQHATGEGTLILLGTLGVNEGALYARMLREVSLQVRKDGEERSRVILIELPETKVPQGLVGDSDLIASPLPSVEELRAELDAFVEQMEIEVAGNGEGRHALACAVAGLPRHEASRSFSRCVAETGKLDAAWLRREKAIRVTTRLGGALTFEKTDGPEIGGAAALREFVERRGKALGRKDARAFGLPEPKGIFLAGLPGCGKSEFARFAARLLGLPLLRLDIGRCMGGIVGESERNMRLAQEAIAACAPAVVLLDECDKAFGGVTGPSGDSGTSQRVFGSFLTFLAEHEHAIFVIATANRAWTLPAEFVRSGRFDAVYHVGTPTVEELADIFRIHLARHGWLKSEHSTVKPEQCAAFAEAATSFSGAEARQAVIEAGFVAFAESRQITYDDVIAAIKSVRPIVETAPEDVKAMEDWAVKVNALRASAPRQKPTAASSKSLRRPNLSGGN